MADYKLWNALKNAKKYRWVELSHSLNNESPYWSGIPEGSVELAKTVWDWGKPELECLIQTFKFPGVPRVCHIAGATGVIHQQ